MGSWPDINITVFFADCCDENKKPSQKSNLPARTAVHTLPITARTVVSGSN